MLTKLLTELGSADETVRSAAITDAGMLSLADLRSLVDLYFDRCGQQMEQPESVTQPVRWFQRRKSRIKANTPSGELVRVRNGLLIILIGTPPNSDYADLVVYTQSRRLPPGLNLELCIPSPILLLRFLPNIDPQDIEGWSDKQRKMLLTSLDLVRLNYPATTSHPSEGMPRGFPFARIERFHIQFNLKHVNLKHVREEALAALMLLQRIGDERELALVRHLAEIKPRTPIGAEIQRAAEESLPFIELRAHQNRQAKTLLRPSDTDANTDPNTLMRPATKSGETLPQELLRPQSGLETL